MGAYLSLELVGCLIVLAVLDPTRVLFIILNNSRDIRDVWDVIMSRCNHNGVESLLPPVVLLIALDRFAQCQHPLLSGVLSQLNTRPELDQILIIASLEHILHPLAHDLAVAKWRVRTILR
jgi:hypothetical protein